MMQIYYINIYYAIHGSKSIIIVIDTFLINSV